MSQPLRLGRIDFVNILPVHLRLAAAPALFIEARGVPSALNRQLRQGLLDVSVISSVEYALHADDYLLLPDLGICSDGPVGSVTLFSRQPMDLWAGRPVEAPFESDTSVALARVLLAHLWRLDCPLAPEGQALDPAATLRIGDRALQEAASGRWAHSWDMGQQWRELTGLPFVFAVWAVRRPVAQARPAEVAALHGRLLAAKAAGVADPAACAAEASRLLGGSVEGYLRYYKLLSYDLGPRFRQGLGRFFAYLAAMGQIERAPRLCFFGADGPQTAT